MHFVWLIIKYFWIQDVYNVRLLPNKVISKKLSVGRTRTSSSI